MLDENELENIASPNYTPGRQGNPVRHITFHHVVGSVQSAVNRFLKPSEQASAHFIVGANRIVCMVNTDDTAWTNGNWQSNLESVTIEHEGDWRFGYYNQAVIDNSARLVAWLRSLYPAATPARHRDIYPTACPGDLPVEHIWNLATNILNPPQPPPPVVTPTPKLVITDIQNRTVKLKHDASLWDLNFLAQSEAKAVKTLPKGTPLEISATAVHPAGNTYYLTEYSYSKGINNGIDVDDCEEVVPTPPPDPTPEPTPDPTPEPTPEPEPTPTPPSPQISIKALIAGLVAAGAALIAFIANWLKN